MLDTLNPPFAGKPAYKVISIQYEPQGPAPYQVPSELREQILEIGLIRQVCRYAPVVLVEIKLENEAKLATLDGVVEAFDRLLSKGDLMGMTK